MTGLQFLWKLNGSLMLDMMDVQRGLVTLNNDDGSAEGVSCTYSVTLTIDSQNRNVLNFVSLSTSNSESCKGIVSKKFYFNLSSNNLNLRDDTGNEYPFTKFVLPGGG
jgi:hypothetical protein